MEGSIVQLGLGNYLINDKASKSSFFKHGYKNYSNFVKHTKKLNFKTSSNFGNTLVMHLDQEANYGDLITNMILEIDLPDVSSLISSTGKTVGYCNGVGNALIKRCDLKIGGNVIDQQDGNWMDIWSTLAIPRGKQENYQNMIKKSINHNELFFQGGKVYVPLMFWFCQNTNYNNQSLPLPILSLRNNNIELIIEFNSFYDMVYTNDGSLPTQQLNIESVNILIDYVILEEKERISYLESKYQMYLLNQVQSQTYTLAANTTNLNISMRNFKYPVTEIFLVIRRNDNRNNKSYFNYNNGTSRLDTSSPINTMRLTLDGKDRLEEMSGEYFTIVEPSKVHDNIPEPNPQIHCYSFSLDPENLEQPSGSCNLSEIYEPMLHIKFKNGIAASTIFLYALNYNVLQIDSSGNAWLLHNLSKNAPTVLPDAQDCNITDPLAIKIEN